MKRVIRITFNAIALLAAYAILMAIMMYNTAEFQKHNFEPGNDVFLSIVYNAISVIWLIVTFVLAIFSLVWPILLINRNQKE